MKNFEFVLLAVCVLISTNAVNAQENKQGPKPAEAKSAEPKAQVLDFSGDVIEGELKRPQLFLELVGTTEFMESTLYQREDFNDFHAVDMRKRLRYIAPAQPIKKQ